MPLLNEFGAADNNMNGTIPVGLTKLTDLIEIYLFESGISGTLPDIGNLGKLEHLALQDNDLSGTIPPSLYGLTTLENLYLSSNRFSGTIPPDVGNLVSLKQFWLYGNLFSGAVPSDVSRLTSLGTLLLSQCDLVCEFYPFAHLCPKVIIFMNDNDFTGGIENFCSGSIAFAVFQSDCYSDGVLVQASKVECSCCTECCFYEEGSNSGCVPNDGTA